MTATIDLTAKIDTLNRTLADATVECPCVTSWSTGHQCDETCTCCKGTGCIARFPGFRQVCRGRLCFDYECGDTTYVHSNDIGTHDDTCCNGTGWQVRAGGLEDGLAGLTVWEFLKWRQNWSPIGKPPYYTTTTMPSAPEILAEGLRLVIEIAELEVPDEIR